MNWQFKLSDLIEKECKCPKGECFMNDIIALVQKEIDKGKKEERNRLLKEVEKISTITPYGYGYIIEQFKKDIKTIITKP